MALDNSSSETRPQVRGENNNRPNGLTRDYSIDRGLYESALNSVSSNVVDALRLSNLGVDPTVFKNMFSVQEKISYETITELDTLSEKFQKYLDSAQTDREKELVQMEYHNKLNELRDEKNRQLQEELKKDDIERMSAFFEKTTSILEENDDSIRGALLGPLNLITKPFEEFFGFDIGKSMRELLFGGKSKKNPTESDVAKIGLAGAGYLYIANTIKSVFGDDDRESPLKGLFGNGGGFSIGKTKIPLKGLGIGAIVTSVLMMVTDGIIGAINAEKNGVSKFSGFLGAFLGGNMSGIKGAIANGGKWALMGFGVGALLAPVTGGLSLFVGPLVGMIVGGVLGAIGGVKIAKAFDKFGEWFTENILPTIKEIFNFEAFADIWKSDKSIPQKIWETLKGAVATLLEFPIKIFNRIFDTDLSENFGLGLINKFLDVLKSLFNVDKFIGIWKGDGKTSTKIWETLKTVIVTVIDFVPKILGLVVEQLGKAKDFVKSFVTNKEFRKEIIDKISGIFGKVTDKIGSVLKKIGSTLWGGLKDIGVAISDSQLGQLVSGLFTKIISAIGNIKTAIVDSPFGQFVSSIFEKVKGFVSNIKNTIVDSPFGQFVSSIFTKLKNGINNWFANNPVGQFLKKYIIDPITGFFSHIADYFKFIKSEGIQGIAEIIGTKKTFEGEFKSWKESQFREELKSTYGAYGGDRLLETTINKAIQDSIQKYGFIDTELIKEQFAKNSSLYRRVNDAILRPDGSVIETNPKDTLVALKDIPSSIRMEEQKRVTTTLERELPISSKETNADIIKRMDTLIKLLKGLSNKDPVKLTLPTMTRQDLDLIMTGGMI